MNTHKKTTIMFALACALVLPGCSSELSEPVSLVVAVDVSSPSEERLTGYGSSLYRVQRGLSSDSVLSVRTFADSGETVYEGERVAGRGKYNERIGSELLKAHKRKRTPGTRSELALEAVADAVERSSLLCVAFIYTDGGVEDQGSSVKESLAKSIKRLAGCEQLVAVVVSGVLPEHRELWKEWLKPLGDKAYVRGTNDADELLAEVIETAKNGGTR